MYEHIDKLNTLTELLDLPRVLYGEEDTGQLFDVLIEMTHRIRDLEISRLQDET
jgi:hypothetical protein